VTRTVDIFVGFGQKSPTPLCEIMSRHGSDKARTDTMTRHNYTHYYFPLFESARLEPLRLFEVGIGTGASLRGWKEFFPHASIFGADINAKTLFTEERVSTFHCDMGSKESVVSLWSNPALMRRFDIIVDDGRHTPESQDTFFENSIHKLARGGVYIIEDVRSHELMIQKRRLSRWCGSLPVVGRLLCLEPEGNDFDNNLVVLQRL
jgi:hypothetical protein